MLIIRLDSRYEEGVLIRHCGETLRVVLADTKYDTAGIGFDGPRSFDIVREELLPSREHMQRGGERE